MWWQEAALPNELLQQGFERVHFHVMLSVVAACVLRNTLACRMMTWPIATRWRTC